MARGSGARQSSRLTSEDLHLDPSEAEGLLAEEAQDERHGAADLVAQERYSESQAATTRCTIKPLLAIGLAAAGVAAILATGAAPSISSWRWHRGADEIRANQLFDASNADKRKLLVRDYSAFLDRVARTISGNISLDAPAANAEKPLRIDDVQSKGPSEWQVVFRGQPGRVNIRKEKDLNSEILGTKATCSVVMGKRDGKWVKLETEPGYIKMELLSRQKPVVLLEERSVSYEAYSNGNCQANGRFPIFHSDVCKIAARALKLGGPRVSLSKSIGSTSGPDGCYWTEQTGLWLALHHANRSAEAGVDCQRICSSVEDACELAASRDEDRSSRGTSEVVTTTAPQVVQHSLFCFAVLRTFGYEPELMAAQRRKGVGVFACDDFMLLSNGGEVKLGPLRTQALAAPTAVPGDPSQQSGAGSSWLNAGLFAQAWAAVEASGRYRRHNWIVKVDPDAVFFPERLRASLAERHPQKPGKLLLLNCNEGDGRASHRLLGAVEVLSREAVQAYFSDGQRCRQELQWTEWGEDYFMQECMSLLGVPSEQDSGLLSDERCDSAPCSEKRVAYHDYKSEESWFACWKQSDDLFKSEVIG